MYFFLSYNEIHMQQLNFVLDNGTKCSNFQSQAEWVVHSQDMRDFKPPAFFWQGTASV